MLRTTRHILSFVAAATAALALEAAPASGAKVAVSNRTLVYTGVGSEANDLRLARHGSRLVVRDLTAALVPGAGCTRVTAHKTRCAGADVVRFSAALGRGDDRMVVANLVALPAIVVRGGAGADTLASVVAHVSFFGGGGLDRLLGGPRADALQGRRGADFIRGRGGPDRIDGGRGDDLIVGGPGADRASGGAGDDRVYGTRGDDVLRGGPGDDILADFFGRDRLYGETGEDYLNTFELVPDGRPGDFQNASAGPDYGCRASPDDVLIGCDENAK
jgi:Ca2+-binding RTX toxin-like protein